MGAEQIVALMTAVGGVIIGVAGTLRKRQDVSIDEMQRRIGSLETRVGSLEQELEDERADNKGLRRQLVEFERRVYRLRSVLAQHGISDPTEEDVTHE